MVRVLRYPRLFGASCISVLILAGARDYCLSAGLYGWARVLMVAVVVMLLLCCGLMSCRFFLNEQGVGIGSVLHLRHSSWSSISALGILCCNSRRPYLYGLYDRSPGFLDLLHCAPRCGSWGFVVPTSRKLNAALMTYCPEEIQFAPIPAGKPPRHMRHLWHQAALYALMMLPGALVAFSTGTLMLIKASALTLFPLILLTLAALGLFAAGAFLFYRVLLYMFTCPRVSDEGVSSGLYLPWEDVHFGYVHRMGQSSTMFFLSQLLEEAGKRGAPPILCLSMPDSTRLMLQFLTCCPHARKSETQ